MTERQVSGSMITIDEAITHAREKAEKMYLQGMLCHANPNDDELDGCIECAREHEQLAEWLEELKAIKDGSIPIIHGKAELEFHDKAIRNKAIDDLSNTLKENYDYLPQIFTKEAFDGYVDEYAEQLKVGVED